MPECDQDREAKCHEIRCRSQTCHRHGPDGRISTSKNIIAPCDDCTSDALPAQMCRGQVKRVAKPDEGHGSFDSTDETEPSPERGRGRGLIGSTHLFVALRKISDDSLAKLGSLSKLVHEFG